MRKSLFVLLILLISSIELFSQELTFTGYTQFENKALPNVQIKVVQNGKLIDEVYSDSKGYFSFIIDFNSNYRLYFDKGGYCLMYAEIDGTVPEEKKIYKIKYEITIPFYLIKDESINKKAFEKPFTKIAFDGKTKFVDDGVYLKNFVETLKLIPETSKQNVNILLEKKYHIAGKIVRDNDTKTPYNLIKVSLVDTAGREFASTLTSKYGVFSFPSVGTISTGKLIVYKNDLTENYGIIIQTMEKETLASSARNKLKETDFSNTKENKLIEKLITDAYVPFIGGKLSYDKNGESVVLAEKDVYLYSDKNELLEKVKTNIFGNFLFSKLPPDKNFIIGIDESDTNFDINEHLHLYSCKDIEISIKDTLINKKHLYRFLSKDVHSYNELLIEDINIKMDLKGKVAGDNVNNTLNGLKILILDKDLKVIDSSRTDGKGNFHVKYLPFSNNISLRFIDTTNSLSNYSNIVIYDTKGNVVKFISVKNGLYFDFKPLVSDLNSFREIFVDDPWLNINALAKKNNDKLLIIENVYFEFNKSELLPASKQTLDKVVLSMLSNKTMKVELGAHSDSKGSDDYNLKLSEQRAQSALDYIVSKGIDKSRISAKGYGEKKLLNKCGNKIECPEEEHAKNRRLEFNIILK